MLVYISEHEIDKILSPVFSENVPEHLRELEDTCDDIIIDEIDKNKTSM